VSARIARGGSASRPRRKAAPRAVNTRRRKPPSMLESFGFSPNFGRVLVGWLLAGMTIVVIGALLLAFRVPQRTGLAVAEAIGDAGFAARQVEIRGAQRVSRQDIYNIALPRRSMPMPLVDLADIRRQLLRFGWVREATVSRRMPDTLVIDIVERVPTAIWQHEGQLSLIDAEGTILEPVRVEAMPDLPLVIGPAANRHLAALNSLLAAAPHLRPQVSGATWVGDRRWDVRFQTGELLTLPEGDDAAQRALQRFAGMDQQSQLLGRGFVRFDMRDPRRMIVRVSREPGSSVPVLATPDPGQPPEDLARTI
jgi:cell division protein FtsQ